MKIERKCLINLQSPRIHIAIFLLKYSFHYAQNEKLRRALINLTEVDKQLFKNFTMPKAT